MRDKLNHFPSASYLMSDLRSSERVTSFTFINMIWVPHGALDKCTWLHSPICWSNIIILFGAIVLIMLICISSRYPFPMWIMSSTLRKAVILLIINLPAPNYSQLPSVDTSWMVGHLALLIKCKAYQCCIGYYSSDHNLFFLFSSTRIGFWLSEKDHLWCSKVDPSWYLIAEGRRKGNCVFLYR